MITMIPVANSTSVIEYGYDTEKNVLIVNFVKTGPYQYANISQVEFDSIASYESPGKGIKAVVVNKIYNRMDEKMFVRVKGRR